MRANGREGGPGAFSVELDVLFRTCSSSAAGGSLGGEMGFSGIWFLASSSAVFSVGVDGGMGFSGVGFAVSSSAGGVDWPSAGSAVGGPSSSGTGERRMRSGACAGLVGG